MPSGRVHLRIEFLLLCALCALGAYLIREGWITWVLLAAFAGSYVGSMLLLSPDLDLSGSRPFKRWGPLKVLWWPYSAVFRHLQLSHHWLLGPVTRVGYVLGWVALIAATASWASGQGFRVRFPGAIAAPAGAGALIASIALGLYVPNAAHVAADFVQTRRKRRRRR